MKRGHQLGLSLQMFLAQHPTIILILYILLSLSLSLSVQLSSPTSKCPFHMVTAQSGETVILLIPYNYILRMRGEKGWLSRSRGDPVLLFFFFSSPSLQVRLGSYSTPYGTGIISFLTVRNFCLMPSAYVILKADAMATRLFFFTVC